MFGCLCDVSPGPISSTARSDWKTVHPVKNYDSCNQGLYHHSRDTVSSRSMDCHHSNRAYYNAKFTLLMSTWQNCWVSSHQLCRELYLWRVRLLPTNNWLLPIVIILIHTTRPVIVPDHKITQCTWRSASWIGKKSIFRNKIQNNFERSVVFHVTYMTTKYFKVAGDNYAAPAKMLYVKNQVCISIIWEFVKRCVTPGSVG